MATDAVLRRLGRTRSPVEFILGMAASLTAEQGTRMTETIRDGIAVVLIVYVIATTMRSLEIWDASIFGKVGRLIEEMDQMLR